MIEEILSVSGIRDIFVDVRNWFLIGRLRSFMEFLDGARRRSSKLRVASSERRIEERRETREKRPKTIRNGINRCIILYVYCVRA